MAIRLLRTAIDKPDSDFGASQPEKFVARKVNIRFPAESRMVNVMIVIDIHKIRPVHHRE